MSEAEAQSRQRRMEKLCREMGQATLDALGDDRVVEVVVNPDGQVWVERAGEPMTPIDGEVMGEPSAGPFWRSWPPS